MKRFRFLRVAVFFSLAGLFSTSAQAGYEGGNFKVAYLRITEAHVYVSLSPAPAVCGGGSSYGEHFRVFLDGAHSEVIYSALLSAYQANSKLSGLWFDDFTGPCSEVDNIPRLRQVRYEAK